MGVVCAVAGARLAPQHIRAIALCASLWTLAADLASMAAAHGLFLAARAGAGLGEGLMLWTAIVVIARQPTPERTTAAFLTGQVIAALVLNAFQSNLVFFYSPTQIAAKEAPSGRTFRVGGMVETGSVKVSLRRRGGVLQFAVTDTGIGISKENLDRIFEKFLQADASTTRRFGGTGLGLALSRERAGLMGGDIAVTSVQGKGSEFVVSLPMRRLSGPARVEASAVPQVAAQAWQQVQSPAQAEAASCPDSADGGRVRILCAEDNEVNQLVLKTLLGQIEVDFEIVGDGAQAVAAWEQAHFDVILMDVQMPVMDGPAATAAIRAAELDAGRNRTPIIALTANVMSHQTAAYIAGGMDEVVAKPIDFKTLLTAIQRQLDGPAADDVGDIAAA